MLSKEATSCLVNRAGCGIVAGMARMESWAGRRSPPAAAGDWDAARAAGTPPTPDRKEGGAWAAGAVMGTAAVPERGSVVAAGIPHRNNRRRLPIPQRRKMIHAVLPGAAGYDGETKAFHL